MAAIPPIVWGLKKDIDDLKKRVAELEARTKPMPTEP